MTGLVFSVDVDAHVYATSVFGVFCNETQQHYEYQNYDIFTHFDVRLGCASIAVTLDLFNFIGVTEFV